MPAPPRRPVLTEEHRRLARLLRSVRIDAGLSQEEVAAKLGRPQSYVSKYETAERRLDLVQMREVCIALGARLVAIVERFEAERPSRRRAPRRTR